MAIYRARLSRDPNGQWIASAVELPNCSSRAASQQEALQRLRDEVRYRIEYCPCSGVRDDYVEIEVLGAAAAPADAGDDVPSRSPATFEGRAGCPSSPSQRPTTAAPASSPPPELRTEKPGWKRWDD